MGRAKPKPKAVILPPDLDDDEEFAGGGIPDEDGWIHLREKRKEKANGEDEKPKRRTGRRRSREGEASQASDVDGPAER
jgi:hypothetical protein